MLASRQRVAKGASNLKRSDLIPWALLFAGAQQFSASVCAQESAAPASELPTVVIQTSAIPGNNIDVDKVPGNVQTLFAADLARDGSASLTGAMNSRLGSISINENLD